MVLEYIKLYTLDLCNWLFVEWHVVKHIFFFCIDPVFWVKLLKFPQKMSSNTILQIRYILWWHFLGFHIWKARENKKLIKLILPQTAENELSSCVHIKARCIAVLMQWILMELLWPVEPSLFNTLCTQDFNMHTQKLPLDLPSGLVLRCSNRNSVGLSPFQPNHNACPLQPLLIRITPT